MNRDAEVLRTGIEQLFGKRLYDYQLAFLKDCIDEQRVTARMCRQTGKSMTLAIYAVLASMHTAHNVTLCIAPTDKQAGIIFDKTKFFLNHLHERERILESSTLRSSVLTNGSRIEALTVGDDGLTVRGHTVNTLIIDESAFIKQKIYNEVLLPTVMATKGKIIESSTPFGKSNHFYEHSHSENWKTHHVPWQVALAAGHLTQHDIEDARSTMTNMQFETEMGANFVDDQNTYFPLQLVSDCTEDYPMITEVEIA